jgi:hypothetical protein
MIEVIKVLAGGAAQIAELDAASSGAWRVTPRNQRRRRSQGLYAAPWPQRLAREATDIAA